MSVFGEFIYWNDRTKHAIMRANKYNGGSPSILERSKDNINKVLDMTVYARERQDCK
jgi:hypothetical protein